MNKTQPSEIHDTIWGTSSLLTHKKEILLVVLTIITLGGAIVNGLGFFGYLPSQAVWIGGVIDIAAIIAIAITCVMRELSKQVQPSNTIPRGEQITRNQTSNGHSNHLDRRGLKTNHQALLTSVTANPEIGKQIMLCDQGKEIDSGEIRLQIFRIAFVSLSEAINSQTLSSDEIHCFLKFMIGVRCPISSDDLEKMGVLSQNLSRIVFELSEKNDKNYERYYKYVMVIDVVIGKLSFQVSQPGFKPRYFSADLVHFEFDKLKIVAGKIQAWAHPNSLEFRSMLYLSLIPSSDPYFVEAQFKLIEMWKSLNNLIAVGECNLAIAKANPRIKGSMESAALYLLARRRIKGGITWDYILREDLEDLQKVGVEVALLDASDLEKFDLEYVYIKYYSLRREKSLETIEYLVQGEEYCHIAKAWNMYLEIAYIRALDRIAPSKMISVGFPYAILPSASLLKRVIEWINEKGQDFKEQVSPQFLEDCQAAYPDLFPISPSV